MTEQSWRRARALVHPAISILVPSLFVLTLHALARGSLGFPAGFPDGLAVLFPLASTMEAVAGNAAQRRRSTDYARLREVILFLLGVLGILVLLRLPLHHYGYLITGVLVCWGLSYGIHAALRSREDLARSTQGLGGRELDRALHQAMILEGDALRRLLRIRAIGTVLTGLLVATAAVLAILGVRITPVAAAFLLLQALTRQLVSAALTTMAADQRLLGQGLRPDGGMRIRRLTHGVLILGGGILVSLVAARSAPLVPLSAVASALEGVARVIRSPKLTLGPGLRNLLEQIFALLARLFPPLSEGGPAMGAPTMPPAGEPSELARRITFALAMTVAAVLLGLLVAFLTAPLEDPDVRETIERGHPLRFLRRRLRLFAGLARDLARRVRGALAELMADTRRALTESRKAASASGAVPAARAGAAGPSRALARRQRSARARARRAWGVLTVWARRAGLEAEPSLAPLELARRASAAAPGSAPDLRAAAELVESVLYAPPPAARASVAELERVVRSIIRVRGRAGGRT